MKLNIIKAEDGNYVLELQSGHFKGKLEGISDEMINDFIKALIDIRSNRRSEVEWVWTPRSRRREKKLKDVQSIY